MDLLFTLFICNGFVYCFIHVTRGAITGTIEGGSERIRGVHVSRRYLLWKEGRLIYKHEQRTKSNTIWYPEIEGIGKDTISMISFSNKPHCEDTNVKHSLVSDIPSHIFRIFSSILFSRTIWKSQILDILIFRCFSFPYFYLSIFLLSDILVLTVWSFDILSFRYSYFRYLSFDVCTFDICTFDVSWVNQLNASSRLHQLLFLFANMVFLIMH